MGRLVPSLFARRAALAAWACVVAWACAIPGLRREVHDASRAVLSGLVEPGAARVPTDATVLVALYLRRADGTAVPDRVVHVRAPWAFVFPVTRDGDYEIVAWVDEDRDLLRDPDTLSFIERAASGTWRGDACGRRRGGGPRRAG